MPTSTKTVTIPAGESVSDAVDISGMIDLYIVAPPEWDGANITFQFSPDGTNFYDLVGRDGEEIMLGMAGRVDTVTYWRSNQDTSRLPNVGQIKFRSGTRMSPIAQKADRVFNLTIFT